MTRSLRRVKREHLSRRETSKPVTGCLWMDGSRREIPS